MSSILIVDDEAIISMQLEERLTVMGYAVAGMVAAGDDAVEKARRLKPDLVLMDIVMPGKINGIEAAKVITGELGIPVVFVTSYADDSIILKAKEVRPYGYIVKPFNELEIKAAIEIALFRKATEAAAQAATGGQTHLAGTGTPEGETGAEYLPIPEVKTLLLKDIFSDIVLFLYTDPVVREPIFKFALEEGIKKGGRNLFCYHRSTLQKFFPKEIQSSRLFMHRIKKDEVYRLSKLLTDCMDSLPGDSKQKTLQVMLDFLDIGEFPDILAVRTLLVQKKEAGVPVSGIFAVNITNLDHDQIARLSEGLVKIIIATGKDTAISFSQPSSSLGSITVVSQATIDDIVKKSLEPVILSLLDKPISGYDIVHEIHNRYKVLIPQARIYTFLYDLQEKGYLQMRVSGKFKLYYPTDPGRKYIRQRLDEFRFVFRHILGDTDRAAAEIRK